MTTSDKRLNFASGDAVSNFLVVLRKGEFAELSRGSKRQAWVSFFKSTMLCSKWWSPLGEKNLCISFFLMIRDMAWHAVPISEACNLYSAQGDGIQDVQSTWSLSWSLTVPSNSYYALFVWLEVLWEERWRLEFAIRDLQLLAWHPTQGVVPVVAAKKWASDVDFVKTLSKALVASSLGSKRRVSLSKWRNSFSSVRNETMV